LFPLADSATDRRHVSRRAAPAIALALLILSALS
jgi:hypothetical protein